MKKEKIQDLKIKHVAGIVGRFVLVVVGLMAAVVVFIWCAAVLVDQATIADKWYRTRQAARTEAQGSITIAANTVATYNQDEEEQEFMRFQQGIFITRSALEPTEGGWNLVHVQSHGHDSVLVMVRTYNGRTEYFPPEKDWNLLEILQRLVERMNCRSAN